MELNLELDPLRELYLMLDKALTEKEVKQIKGLLIGRQIEKGILDGLQSFQDICLHLEEKGYISKNKLQFLIKLLSGLDRENLKRKVIYFQECQRNPNAAQHAGSGLLRSNSASDLTGTDRPHIDVPLYVKPESRTEKNIEKDIYDKLSKAAEQIFEDEVSEIRQGNSPEKYILMHEAFLRYKVRLKDIQQSTVTLTLRTWDLNSINDLERGINDGNLERHLTDILVSGKMEQFAEDHQIEIRIIARLDQAKLAKAKEFFQDLYREKVVFDNARGRRLQLNVQNSPFINQLNLHPIKWPTTDAILEFHTMLKMVYLCREVLMEKYRRDMLQWAIDRRKIENLEKKKLSLRAKIKELQSAKDITEKVAIREKTKRTASSELIDRQKIESLEKTKSSYEATIKELQAAKETAEKVAIRERTKSTASYKVDVSKKRRKIEELDIGQCEGCKEREAVHSCIECDSNFCSSCITAHEDMESSKSHREVKLDKYLEELSGEVSKQSKVHCSIHPQNEVHLFCDSCQVSICPACIATHPVPDHVHRDLQDAADQYREQLKEMMEKLKKHEHTAKSHGSDEATKDKLEVYRKEEEDIIKRKAEKMIQKVELEKSRLIKTIKIEFDEIRELVLYEFNEWEKKHGNITKICNFLESLLHDGNAARLLSSKKETMHNIHNFVHKTNQLIKSELIKFQPSVESPEHEMLGFLKMDVSASMCTVENMPTRLVRGESVNVTLRITDRRGKPVISYKEIIAKMWKEDGSWKDIVAVDNGNCTHSLRIDADVGGRHEVIVKLGDQPIPGSPFVISVKGLVKTIGKGQLSRPTGITTNKHGDFVTADWGNKRIYTADRDGNYKSSFTFTQFEKPFVPEKIAVSADDEYFMSDSGNNQVVVSDEDGQLLRYFGQNELKYAYGIAISPLGGSVYVTDWDGKGDDTDKEESHCVRKFTQHGQHIKSFGNYGTKQGEFFGPNYVAINSLGEIFVSDDNNSRVQVFSADCEFLYLFHNINSDDRLRWPKGISTGEDSCVYVCDRGKKRVLKLDSRGRFISRIDSDEDGLDWPHGITLTNDVPCRVAVVDHINDCIKVFAQ